jgi:predicted DNA-binding transcriptional regulator AlpA
VSTKKAPAAQVEPAAVNSVRLISKPEVCDRVGRTFPTIWKWMRDGEFPRARDLGGKPAWIESEVEAWITGLPKREYMGDAGYDPPPHVKAKRRRSLVAA